MNESKITKRQAQKEFGWSESIFYKLKKGFGFVKDADNSYSRQNIEAANDADTTRIIVMPEFKKEDPENRTVCKNCYQSGLRLFQHDLCADCLNGKFKGFREIQNAQG